MLYFFEKDLTTSGGVYTLLDNVLIFKCVGNDFPFPLQVVAHFALQDLKEQCEFLETLFLYYVHFDMKTGDLVKLAKAFKGRCSFPLEPVTFDPNSSQILNCF